MSELEFKESELVDKLETLINDSDWLRNPKWEGAFTIQNMYEKEKYETFWDNDWCPEISVILEDQDSYHDSFLLHVDMHVGAWTTLIPMNAIGAELLKFTYEQIGDHIASGEFAEPSICKAGMETLHMEYMAY